MKYSRILIQCAMNEADSAVTGSPYAYCKFTRNANERVPKITTRVATTMPNLAKRRYDILLKRNRCLGVGVLVLLLALAALIAFVLAEKLCSEKEYARFAQESHRSIDELSATLNSTMERLRNETTQGIDAKIKGTDDLIKNTIQHLMVESKTVFERKILDEVKDVRRHVDEIVRETHATVNATIVASKQDIISDFNEAVKKIHTEAISSVEQKAEVASSNIERMVNRSMSEMDGLLDEARTLMNTTIEQAVQQSLITINEQISKAMADLEIELLYGTVFTFDIKPLLKNLSETDPTAKGEPQTKLVGELPIGMRVTLQSAENPYLLVHLACSNDPNVLLRVPLQKSLHFIFLNSKNTEFRNMDLPLAKVGSCQNPKDTVWTFVMAYMVSKLREESVLDDDIFRLGLKLKA